VLAALRPLLPRLYSISSSQLEHARRVQVTVAVVRYASLNRQRIGVTSTQLAERIQAQAAPR
jgi:sulfite reductase (NADPH) flavoprotein alpha-component